MDSITQFLLQNGFQEDQNRNCFKGKDDANKEVLIPFVELSGHTVGTFTEKAHRKGWIQIKN